MQNHCNFLIQPFVLNSVILVLVEFIVASSSELNNDGQCFTHRTNALAFQTHRSQIIRKKTRLFALVISLVCLTMGILRSATVALTLLHNTTLHRLKPLEIK